LNIEYSYLSIVNRQSSIFNKAGVIVAYKNLFDKQRRDMIVSLLFVGIGISILYLITKLV